MDARSSDLSKDLSKETREDSNDDIREDTSKEISEEICGEAAQTTEQPMRVSFEVKKLALHQAYWDLQNSVHQISVSQWEGEVKYIYLPPQPLDQSGITINLQFVYGNCEKHSILIHRLHHGVYHLPDGVAHTEGVGNRANYEEDHQTYTINATTFGMLSSYSMSQKFDTSHIESPDTTVKLKQVEEGNHVEIILHLPSENSDHLLRKLSLIGDTIKTLQNNGIDVDFDLFTIIKKIDQEYSLNNLSHCECAITIKKLVMFLSINENISGDEAILFLYCFNALKSIDHSLFSAKFHSLNALNNEIISIIDKIFSTPFKKQTDNFSLENQLLANNSLNDEVNHFLERINLCQRIKLYSPCLGKPILDRGIYDWSSYQWLFLKETQYKTYKTDGKDNLYIEISPSNSESYNDFYHPDQRHGELDKDLLAWADHVNLSFSDKTEWHKTIFFSPESSQQLLAMKLHYNLKDIKSLIKARNNYSFFQQACRSGNLRNLVYELVKDIFTLALGPMCSQQDLAKKMI
jgi:hypothetical protein